MTAKMFSSIYNNQLTITEIEQSEANANGDEYSIPTSTATTIPTMISTEGPV